MRPWDIVILAKYIMKCTIMRYCDPGERSPETYNYVILWYNCDMSLIIQLWHIVILVKQYVFLLSCSCCVVIGLLLLWCYYVLVVLSLCSCYCGVIMLLLCCCFVVVFLDALASLELVLSFLPSFLPSFRQVFWDCSLWDI